MNLEPRYVVLKLKDMEAAGVTADEIAAFNAVRDKVSASRISSGKGLLECLVIEKDWPEYRPTLDALSARVDGVPCAPAPEAAGDDGCWRDRYMRDVEGLNSEGDPIGGEPPVGLRRMADAWRARYMRISGEFDAMKENIQLSSFALCFAIEQAGGSVTMEREDFERLHGKSVLGKKVGDRFTFEVGPSVFAAGGVAH